MDTVFLMGVAYGGAVVLALSAHAMVWLYVRGEGG